jgi:hypothetical protein
MNEAPRGDRDYFHAGDRREGPKVPACVEQISCHVLKNFNLTLLQNHPGKLALSMHRVNSKISSIVILRRSVEEGEVDREPWLRLGSIVFRQKKNRNGRTRRRVNATCSNAVSALDTVRTTLCA